MAGQPQPGETPMLSRNETNRIAAELEAHGVTIYAIEHHHGTGYDFGVVMKSGAVTIRVEHYILTDRANTTVGTYERADPDDEMRITGSGNGKPDDFAALGSFTVTPTQATAALAAFGALLELWESE